jgi:lantibiotic modifying enzyme
MHKVSPDPNLLYDIEKAIELVRTDQITDLDQLCCGVLGQSELLLSAGLYFNKLDWVSDAKKIAELSVKAATNEGGFKLLNVLPTDLPMPGFMQGEAGIAYQLLRLNQPSRIPSVLALRTQ